MTRWHQQAQRWLATSWVLTGALFLAPAHTTIAQAVYKVTDANGALLDASPASTVYVMRPIVNR